MSHFVSQSWFFSENFHLWTQRALGPPSDGAYHIFQPASDRSDHIFECTRRASVNATEKRGQTIKIIFVHIISRWTYHNGARLRRVVNLLELADHLTARVLRGALVERIEIELEVLGRFGKPERITPNVAGHGTIEPGRTHGARVPQLLARQVKQNERFASVSLLPLFRSFDRSGLSLEFIT